MMQGRVHSAIVARSVGRREPDRRRPVCHLPSADYNGAMFRHLFWGSCLLLFLLGLPPTGDWLDGQSGLWNKMQLSVIYGALTALGTLAYPRRSGMVITVLCLIAMVTELLQSVLPWLRADLYDTLAAFTGVTVTRVFWAVAFKR